MSVLWPMPGEVGERKDRPQGGDGTAGRLDDLVEIMPVNGQLMPGHQPIRVSPQTVELVRAISRPLALVRRG